MSKHVLIISQYFYPENFKGNDIAFELSKKGYKVEVLTGIPNYPEGKYHRGYGILKRRIETIKGVKVYRAFQYPRGKKIIGLSLNYLSFVFSTLFWVFYFVILNKRYDAIFFQQLSPATGCIPAILLSKLKKIPLYTWVLDIWPDSVISTIGNKSKTIEPVLNCLVDWMYKNSTKLLITSKGMAELINRNSDYSEKIIYYPNWSDDIKSLPIENIPTLPYGYKIMMAGNIADGLGIDTLIALLEEMDNTPEVKFIFVGGGNLQDVLKSKCEEKKLNNVFILGQFPFSKMPAFYNQADAMLLTLKATTMLHLDVTIPARLQSYMAGGKPILAMIGSGASNLIKEAQCGYAVPAGDYKALAKYIKENVLTDKESFALKGENGRAYYEKYFKMDDSIVFLEKIMFK